MLLTKLDKKDGSKVQEIGDTTTAVPQQRVKWFEPAVIDVDEG